jgi:hypothetical protein
MLFLEKKQLKNIKVSSKHSFFNDTLYLLVFIKYKNDWGYADFKDCSLKKQLKFLKLFENNFITQNVIKYISKSLKLYPNYHDTFLGSILQQNTSLKYRICELEQYIDKNETKYTTTHSSKRRRLMII